LPDALIQIAQDVGYTKGKVDALVLDNAEAHKEMKASLEKTAENILATKTDLVAVHTELALHAANIVKLTERVDGVEYKQKYITGLAALISKHPRVFIGACLSVIAIIMGWGVDEVLKLLGGGG
jgi:hypothetical protein